MRVSIENAVEVCLSPGPIEAESETHTIVTYDRDTHFDVNNNKIGCSVWWKSSFEVITSKTQNWKQDFLNI